MAAQDYNVFWSKRPFHIIGTYPINEWKTAKQSETTSRLQRVEQLRSTFFSSDIGGQVSEREHNADNKGHVLRQWAINKSWSYCSNCKLLNREKLLPSYQTSRLNTVKSCPCSTHRYHIPKALEIPFCLHGLTKAEILALRPFTLHTGNYKVHQHGYRQKDGFCRVTWSEQPVLEKISTLESASYLKCMLAYRYLTTSVRTRYNHFILLREEHIKNGKQLNLYDYRENDGIEGALWPHLYPFHEWCETKLSGNTSRQSVLYNEDT
jgi:hypothetical protein